MCPFAGILVGRKQRSTRQQRGECSVASFLLALKVSVRCAPQHGTEHTNKRAHTVVPDRNSNLRDRFVLREHLKGSKQPRLLSPAPKWHTHLLGKCTHKGSASHASTFCPAMQRAVIRDIV